MGRQVIRVVVAVFCGLGWGCGSHGPPGFWAFEPDHLEYRADSMISFSGDDTFDGPGAAVARLGNHEWRGQTLPDPGRYFQAIDTGEEAVELCELLLWGARVESEEELRRIVAAYAEHGFVVGTEEAITRDECWIREVDRSFEGRVQETIEGFDVALTAYVLPEGMGARAKLARFHYHVTRTGAVELKQEDVYLEGPCLNWQTAIFSGLDPDREKEAAREEEVLAADREEHARRARLIQEVYRNTSRALPPGRRM